MDELITKFLQYLATERGFSPRTVEAYRHDLSKFTLYLNSIGRFEVSSIGRADIGAFISSLATSNAEVTKARKLSVIKSFFNYLEQMDVIGNNPATHVIAPKIPQKEASYLNVEEYQRLIQTVRDVATPHYLQRDLAIVTLFLHTGVRLSELVSLTLGSIDLTSQMVVVKGKGNKERPIPLNGDVIEVINKYLAKRPTVDSDSLFISKLGKGLSSRSVHHLIKRYLREAGINKKKVGVHSLRHSFGASLLDKGVNLVVIQELLGHTKLETTRRYLHINKDDLRTAVDSLVSKK
jgi:site-specific recombinase XerD